jgi:hypothetical protein
MKNSSNGPLGEHEDTSEHAARVARRAQLALEQIPADQTDSERSKDDSHRPIAHLSGGLAKPGTRQVINLIAERRELLS